ncbi:hypothetical protein SCLCIDRAFT_25968 [Scleroderma citrinum Foug A]|uniref:non-specific serine/threonine protein kinase n=1 Tax=Scleroderma citrinum Foug A TaxID=1036808 RepID=A0A0C3DZP1_9AGAM|nr:hypothetical protein SCLCIDRAFT_25968 [Scleroderma citrinum Foug A]
MVLENLSPSLDKLIQASPDGALGLGHVAELGLQMISHLEYIHSHNFIHRDIKPQNILMGTEESKGTTFLINFSITKQYCHPSSHIHIPMNEYSQFVGTPAFTSINSHLGGELG